MTQLPALSEESIHVTLSLNWNHEIILSNQAATIKTLAQASAKL